MDKAVGAWRDIAVVMRINSTTRILCRIICIHVSFFSYKVFFTSRSILGFRQDRQPHSVADMRDRSLPVSGEAVILSSREHTGALHERLPRQVSNREQVVQTQRSRSDMADEKFEQRNLVRSLFREVRLGRQTSTESSNI